MKKIILVLAAGFFCTTISAQSLYINGSKKGEIESDGDVYIGGSKKGQIESDGDVYVNGSKKGQIESDGDIYLNGSKVGQIESDGDVYKNGSKIGQIESDGDIYKNGSKIGDCKGVKQAWVGAVVFFFFIEDLAYQYFKVVKSKTSPAFQAPSSKRELQNLKTEQIPPSKEVCAGRRMCN